MGWHRFTKRAYFVLALLFLAFIVIGYIRGCVSGEPFGLTSRTFRGGHY